MFKRLKDYFIPHEGNNYSPNSLEKGAMLGMLFLVLLSFTATNIFSFLWTSSSWLVGSVLPAVIVELTNEERSDSALGVLRRSSVLDRAAQLKANDMAKNSYFAHYSPDGVSPWHWFGEANYNFVHAGENLAVHFSDSEKLVDAWMESPTHRANIMNGNYSEIGIGTAEGTYEGFKTLFVVQLFGTPAAAEPIVAVKEAPVPVVAGETTDTVATQEKKAVLAESVTLTETVTIKEAEAEQVPVEETKPVAPKAVQAPIEEKVVEVKPELTTTTPAQVQITDTGVALYSDFVSTSTGGIPATINSTEVNESTPFIASVVTKPNRILQMLYMVIGAFVFISLMMSILIEVRRQQPVQIAYGVGLLSLMFGLFYIHSVLISGVSII
jgi:hypothetical protein